MMKNYKVVNFSQDIPLVTVAILAYNHAMFIAKTIESALTQQTNFRYKIIIAEDCSTDSTREIVLKYQQKYPEKIKLILQKKNVGARQNNLDILSNIESKYIACLEGDDYWTDPQKLQKQIDILEENPSISICATNFNFDIDGTTVFNKNLLKKKTIFTHIDLIYSNRIATLTTVFRNKNNFLDEFKNASKEIDVAIGDYLLWLILTKDKSKVAILEDITANYRILQESASHSKNNYRKIQFEWEIFKIQNYFISRIVDNEIKLKVLKSVVNSKLATFFHKYDRVLARKQFRYLFTLLKKNNLPLTLKNKIRYHLIKFNI